MNLHLTKRLDMPGSLQNDLAPVSKNNIPAHVAIIMDGNGRWAAQNRVSTITGHRTGAEVVKKIVRHAAEKGIRYLTLYAFSSENWSRPSGWVEELMGLLRYYLKNRFRDLAENGVCLKVIGDTARLPADIISLIRESEDSTAHNKRITLLVALSYGARDEIINAVKILARQVKDQTLQPDEITAEIFRSALYTGQIPDPDLFIRTSGEERISNFLLWQMAYTEFVFTPVLWPDFTPDELDKSLEIYQRRERRYGSVNPA
jgi:undecaprenyl diphosphate synthase